MLILLNFVRNQTIDSIDFVHDMLGIVSKHKPEFCPGPRSLPLSFLGSSITGAPKHRPMEIIDRLEHGLRGLYRGLVRFLSQIHCSA